MAPKNKTKAKSLKQTGSNKKNESDGLLHGLITVLLSILIVLVAFGGAFYYVLKNNIYGLGEQFRPSLSRIPIIKMALPPLPANEDPDDPKHLTQAELLEKYSQFRNVKADLDKQLESAYQRIRDLEAEKEQWNALKEEAEATALQNEETLKDIQEQTAKMEQDRKELSRLIAAGDKEGFREYFEKVDSETAKALYSELVIEEQQNNEIKNLAKTYAEMEPANAAAILTELGSTDMPLLLQLMGSMKSDVSAEIIENMEPKFAAEIMIKRATKNNGGDSGG